MKKISLNNLKKNRKTCGYILCFICLTMVVLSCSSQSTPTPGVTPPVVTPPVTPPTTTPLPAINTNSTTAKEIIVDMGGGFNLGNVFDNGINASTPSSNKAIIDLYYSGGMRHVRIPTTWMDGFSSNLADANGNLNTAHPRFLELKEIIDYALAKKMYVVLNTHHEHWLKNNYDGTTAFDTKFNKL